MTQFMIGAVVIVAQYMAALDSDDPSSALGFMEPDVRFRIVLPESVVSGASRDEWATYITSRSAQGRVHHVLRSSRDRDVELYHGMVTEHDEPKGVFLSAGHISPQGRIQRYLAFFDTSYRLLEWPPAETD